MLLQQLRNLRLRLRYARKQRRSLKKWEANGRPNPPPHAIKKQNLLRHAREFNIGTLVETGTYHGDMIDAVRNDFQSIYSIELSDRFFHAAKKRFSRQPHVHILHGDSGERLGELMADIKAPAIFWLDGHYSAGTTARGTLDCPVYRELSHILDHPVKNHVILIDDARCFGRDKDYPSIEELQQFVLTKSPHLLFSITNDCICITPSR